MKKRIWLRTPIIEENTIEYSLKDSIRLMGKPYYKRQVNQFVHEKLQQSPGFVFYKCKSRTKSEREITDVFEKLSSLIGNLNERYGKLFTVEDQGKDYINSKIPVSMTNRETGMHTDSSAHDYFPEIVGLCCIQPAAEGGELMLSNGANYYADTLLASPDVIKVLERNHIRDLVTPAMERSVELLRQNKFPIIKKERDEFLVRYMRLWIERGALEAGEILDKEVEAAMDHFDEYINHPENQLLIKMQKGDMVFFNNKFLLHGRSRYRDVEGSKRKMLRTWMNL